MLRRALKGLKIQGTKVAWNCPWERIARKGYIDISKMPQGPTINVQQFNSQ